MLTRTPGHTVTVALSDMGTMMGGGQVNGRAGGGMMGSYQPGWSSAAGAGR
ncbi:MAG: hypothetical protein ACHP9Z_32055 [Streptosporangiales bacterium]